MNAVQLLEERRHTQAWRGEGFSLQQFVETGLGMSSGQVIFFHSETTSSSWSENSCSEATIPSAWLHPHDTGKYDFFLQNYSF